MLSLCATLTLLLTANPEVGLVKRTMSGATDATVAVVLQKIAEGLEGHGLGARAVSTTCGGEVKCLASVARDSRLAAVVAVTIVRGRRELTIDLEAVDAAQRQLAVQTFEVPLSGAPFPAEGAEFFRALKTALAKSVDDSPRTVELAPKPQADSEPIPEVVKPRGSNRLMLATGVTTVVTGVAGLALLIAGLVAKGQLEARLTGNPVVGITRREAERRADVANALGTASAISFGVAGAGAVTTGILWLMPAQRAEEPLE